MGFNIWREIVPDVETSWLIRSIIKGIPASLVVMMAEEEKLNFTTQRSEIFSNYQHGNAQVNVTIAGSPK